MRIREIGVIFEKPSTYLLLFTLMSLTIWMPSNFLRRNKYIGEAFEAYHGGLNLQRFHGGWAGLQDYATSNDPQAHPFLYVHHANSGLYFSWFLNTIGIESFEAQNMVSGLGFLAGLLAGYGLISYITGSRPLGLVFLAFLCFDYWSAVSWAFNIHRAFGYVSVFGVLLCYRKWFDSGSKAWLAGFAVAALSLLGTDYMYYFFTSFVLAIGTVWGFVDRPWSWRERARGILIAILVLGGLFILRQVQVIAGMGWDQWKHDFLYQVLNRLNLQGLYPGDWNADTGQFYETNHVLNPGFFSHVSWPQRGRSLIASIGAGFNSFILGNPLVIDNSGAPFIDNKSPTASEMLRSGYAIFAFLGAFYVLMSWKAWRGQTEAHTSRLGMGLAGLGILGMALGLNASLWFTLKGDPDLNAFWWVLFPASILLTCGLVYQIASIACAGALTEEDWGPVWRLGRLGGVMLLACLCMYALFPRYFMILFPFFNLIAVCVMVWIVAVVAPIFLAAAGQGRLGGLMLLIVLLKVSAVAPQMPTMPQQELTDYGSVLRGMEGKVVYSNWTPASVSSFTRNFSASLTVDGVRLLAEGHRLDMKDYYLFCERNRDLGRNVRPEYFVYFTFPNVVPLEIEDLLRNSYPVVYETNAVVIYDVRIAPEPPPAKN